MNAMVYYYVHKSPLFVPIMRQINPSHPPVYFLIKSEAVYSVSKCDRLLQ